MKKFKVTASYTTYCTAEIEAEDEDQAFELARCMDGGSFTPDRYNSDWYITDVREIEQ